MTATDLYAVTLDVMIDEVRREITARRYVYPRLIADQKLNARIANRRIEIMEAVLARLVAEATE